MNTSSIRIIVMFLLAITSLVKAYAVDERQVPEEKRSTAGLYFTSVEASGYMVKNPGTTLFLDIRDPVEIFTVGMPMVADRNIPFKRVDIHQWDKEKRTYKLASNPGFIKEVEHGLKAKGLNKGSTIILLCGSGLRSAKAASALAKKGYLRVYSVIDGYDTWQESGLAWSKKLDRNKMYGDPKE